VTLFGAVEANQGQASLAQRPGLEEHIACQLDTLDNYVGALNSPRVDMVKIDTEAPNIWSSAALLDSSVLRNRVSMSRSVPTTWRILVPRRATWRSCCMTMVT
jgi:hypothetical protein